MEPVAGIVLRHSGRRGVADLLYMETLRLYNGEPYAYAARETARLLRECRAAAIVTGFRIPPHGPYETDGLMGSAALAYMLRDTFSMEPVIVVEKGFEALVSEALRALGVEALITSVEPGDRLGALEAARLVAGRGACIVFYVEKPGPNPVGEMHSMRGVNVTRLHMDISVFHDALASKGVVSMGFGDGGNEAGMGAIWSYARRIIPYGSLCRCPCRSGIASILASDYLLVATTSDWAVYGYLAALSMYAPRIRRVLRRILDIGVEKILTVLVEHGAVDGVLGEPSLSIDGLPARETEEVIRDLLAVADHR